MISLSPSTHPDNMMPNFWRYDLGRMSISLTQDEITDLANVNGIPFELTISSSDAETKNAIISANSTIELKVQVEVKIDVDE